MTYNKICKICGKEFISNRINQNICKDEHFVSCSICGNLTKLTARKTQMYLNNELITCSKKCALEKSKITCMERYGRESTFDTEKSRKTKLERYGDANYNNREKAKQTNMDLYGTDNPSKSTIIKDKIVRTNNDRYGVDYTFQTDGYIENAKNIKKSKYGEHYEGIGVKISNAWNNKTDEEKQQIIDRIKNVKKEKYGYTYYNLSKASETMQNKYGVPYYCMAEDCKNANGHVISKINTDFKQELENIGIKGELEFRLDKYSYDIMIEPNILIEINPTYTHNSTLGPIFNNVEKKPVDMNYHYDKSVYAKDNDYRCIHIWDWDDKNKILDILNPNKEVVYARKCVIKELDKRECADFENLYHLQGSCNNQEVMLGLCYNNELVEIMTFGKPRYNKNYEWELLRLCTHKDYKVVGGTEKLFRCFITVYEPKSIISYCDASKFSGDVYRRLGFELKSISGPCRHWYDGKRHITDNLLRQRGFDQLFHTDYGKGTSNELLMIQRGFVEVYDSGQYIFEWR